ncbi:hypothetical protein ROZALSC1DRAFT_27776 [Rozella allomycis CSF55]|uniref:Uncharacterized protein n=1 Tax=Rozella allomycis (strain CSF55) TaxID=988480 RepID=A0A075B087_ROZAC|nr:hypothetical protein O9G_004315 [Rozella allomycis CSF55]RKP20766.1 hypothetical protein ROZALSC1DRAFT_27776 [Rozella allomycis CSF55]|eukprot:EPZ34199.1 hypothetical protein O9G_004315 [Rozella allomycis CSF55]
MKFTKLYSTRLINLFLALTLTFLLVTMMAKSNEPQLESVPSDYSMTFERKGDYTSKIKKLKDYLLNDKSNEEKNKLTFRCHEHPCGGLGDRMRGAIFVFYLSLFTNRRYDFNWDFPHPIELFIDTPSFIKHTYKSDENPHIIYHIDNYSLDWVRNTNFVKDWEKFSNVEIRSNNYLWLHLFENQHFQEIINRKFSYLKGLNKFELTHIAMNILFNESPSVILKINNILKNVPSMYKIGIQHRTGDKEFGVDWIRHSPRSGACLATQAVKVCKESKIKCAFFITSDSPKSLLKIKSIISKDSKDHIFMDSPGIIKHVDMPGKTNSTDFEENYSKTYVDWFLLSRMDALIISRSGFGELASTRFLPSTYRLDLEKSECVFQSYFQLASEEYGELRALYPAP